MFSVTGNVVSKALEYSHLRAYGNPEKFGIRFLRIRDRDFEKFPGSRRSLQTTQRLEICQKNYTIGFLGHKFYTLKVRKLQRFLLKRNSVNALRSVILVDFLLEFN